MADDMLLMAAKKKKKNEQQVLVTVENAWVEWYGEEDVRIFSRFLLSFMVILHRNKTAWAHL
jgi:hypothetical protein